MTKYYRKDFCIHGHAYTPENSRYKRKPNGKPNGRNCIACEKIRGQRRRKTNRGHRHDAALLQV